MSIVAYGYGLEPQIQGGNTGLVLLGDITVAEQLEVEIQNTQLEVQIEELVIQLLEPLEIEVS